MDPLVRLGRLLRERGYAFVTPTPATHARVLARRTRAQSLRDVFGWSLPFDDTLLDGELREAAAPFVAEGRSTVRFSTLGALLLAHSAYPTTGADAVFFGPDTYRFCALLDARIGACGHVADVGCGTGAGGLVLAPRAKSVQLLDVNPQALRFARANAELNGAAVRVAVSDVLDGAEGPLDLIVSNPPYLADSLGRAYRDGGGERGTALSTRIAEQALDRLRPGGRLLLYTATPVVDGRHVLRLPSSGVRADYRELDPDVFGEELETEAYAGAERIAVVAFDAVKL